MREFGDAPALTYSPPCAFRAPAPVCGLRVYGRCAWSAPWLDGQSEGVLQSYLRP